MNTLVVLKTFHLFFIRNIHGTSLTWDAVKPSSSRLKASSFSAASSAASISSFQPALVAIWLSAQRSPLRRR
jgi:hypothetical protein